MFEYNIKLILSFVVTLYFYVGYVDPCSTSTSTQSPADSIVFLGKGAAGAVYTKSNSDEYAFKIFFRTPLYKRHVMVLKVNDARNFRDSHRVCVSYKVVNIAETEKELIKNAFKATYREHGTFSSSAHLIIRADPEMVPLKSYIKQNSQLPKDFYLKVLEDVCTGLSFIHRLRRYWGDLKSENVMVHPTTHRAVLVDLDTLPKIGHSLQYWTPNIGPFNDPTSKITDNHGPPYDIYTLGIMILDSIGMDMKIIERQNLEGNKMEKSAEFYRARIRAWITNTDADTKLYHKRLVPLKYLGLSLTAFKSDSRPQLSEVQQFLKQLLKGDNNFVVDFVSKYSVSIRDLFPKVVAELHISWEKQQAPLVAECLFFKIFNNFLSNFWPLIIDPDSMNYFGMPCLLKKFKDILFDVSQGKEMYETYQTYIGTFQRQDVNFKVKLNEIFGDKAEANSCFLKVAQNIWDNMGLFLTEIKPATIL